MAYETASSDLPALREFVTPDVTGMAFEPDRPERLAECLMALQSFPELRRRLGRAAHEWVIKERNWNSSAQKLLILYESLAGHTR